MFNIVFIVCLLLLFEGVPLPLGAGKRLLSFIVALSGPSISLFGIRPYE